MTHILEDLLSLIPLTRKPTRFDHRRLPKFPQARMLCHKKSAQRLIECPVRALKFCLRLIILHIAGYVQFVAASTENRRWDCLCDGKDEVGCEVGSSRGGQAKLPCGRLAGEGGRGCFKRTSNMLRVRVGDGGCVARAIDILREGLQLYVYLQTTKSSYHQYVNAPLKMTSLAGLVN